MGNTASTSLAAAGGFTNLTRPAASSFLTRDVPAPANVIIRTDAFARILVQNNFTGTSLTVRFTVLRSADGVIFNSQDIFLPDATGVSNVFTVGLTEGFLLSATILCASPGPRRGQCFVQVQLCVGSTSDLHITHLLMQDYVSVGYALGWPGGNIRQSTEGPGRIRTVAIADPGTPTDVSSVVPSNVRWRLLSFLTNFTPSGIAGNRVVRLSCVNDAGQNIWVSPVSATIPAASARVISWLPGVQASLLSTTMMASLPDPAILQAGYTITTSTQAIDAGDRYSVTFFVVEEWIES